MRSVAGGYDNECIAVAAIVATFYLWCRSLRNQRSWPIGIIAGIMYVYMVAAWGGYVFVSCPLASPAHSFLLVQPPPAALEVPASLIASISHAFV